MPFAYEATLPLQKFYNYEMTPFSETIGCFPSEPGLVNRMQMKSQLLVAALFLGSTLLLNAVELEGINIPEEKTVQGQTLRLNGAGVRSVKLAMIPIKAYVASLYAPEPLKSEAAVVASPGPLQFNFTFLRGVTADQVADAWNAQFKESATYKYDGYEADLAKFVGFFGALGKGETQTVELTADETIAYVNGKKVGTIPGSDFRKTFISLWFGSQPVQKSLKSELLGS